MTFYAILLIGFIAQMAITMLVKHSIIQSNSVRAHLVSTGYVNKIKRGK